jgi:hypothetical protein
MSVPLKDNERDRNVQKDSIAIVGAGMLEFQV